MADEDVVYVDVVPRLDEAAADEAAESLKDKFKDATKAAGDGIKDFGDKLKDEFSGISDKLKDVFSHEVPKELQGQSEKMGEDIGDKISTSIGEKLKEKLGGAGGTLKDVFGGDLAKDLGKELGSQLGDHIGDALGDVLPKNISDSLGKAVTEALSGKKGLKEGLGDAVREQLSDVIKNDIGLDLGGLGLDGLVGGLGGPALGFAATGLAGYEGLKALNNDRLNQDSGTWQRYLTTPDAKQLSLSQFVQQSESNPYDLFPHAEGIPGAGPLLGASDSDALTPAPQNYTAGGQTLLPIPENPNPGAPKPQLPSGGGSTIEAQTATVDAGTATVMASSISIAGGNLLGGVPGAGTPKTPFSGTPPTATTPKSAPANSSHPDDLGGLLGAAGYSAGGDVTGPGPIGQDSVLAMLAPGEGVLTPSQNDVWKSLMGKGIPHFAGGSGGGDVSAPAPSGGEAMDAVGGGDQGGGDSGGSDQGGDGGAPGTVGGTQAPGAVQDPADQAQDAIGQPGQDVTDPAQEGLAGGTKTSKGIQDQSYGYGKGFSVTGQGLIGFAESAPGAIASAAAAGAGYDGSGAASGAVAAALTSAWNTIGEPELNEAITQGVKIGADLASAPSQEFAVGGENFQNWSQKLIGGEIGNVTNLINTAANTQAPLTPQQGSGSVGQAAQPGGQGGLGGQPSPQGTPNDPMHVSVVGGQSPSSQSSGMTSIGMDSSGTS